MQVLVILEVDEDAVIKAYHGDDPSTFEGTLEDAIGVELRCAERSGISVVTVMCTDDDHLKTFKNVRGKNILETY